MNIVLVIVVYIYIIYICNHAKADRISHFSKQENGYSRMNTASSRKMDKLETWMSRNGMKDNVLRFWCFYHVM